ncbi:YihY/virulence factor BrkB family protein [Alkalibacter rhizosphaerae]|uniref:YihY/virulence factor BrkB family protein n=1 Tax=Alkalibacter rhizosphaerae TaxID=2815577 RepID=A0A974XD03_9FIRM|nr:YihY/virulence factor BrkB family protein [Alkalibacter rhizosphaerae]QSX07544.1 YihY/virulence factor BrkB family protein [Alkalibacter rhizosphaerae]
MMSQKKPVSFIKLLLQRTGEDNLIAYAYQLTYSLMLAVFPFLIFLFTLVGYSNLDSGPILEFLRTALPLNIYELIASIVIDIVDQQRSGLMSISVVLAIYSASAGFRAFMRGTNVALGLSDQRHLVKRYLLSLLLVVLFAVTILLSLLGIVFGQQILDLITAFIPRLPLENLLKILRILLPLAFIFFLILCFYVFVPAKRLRFRHALPGAIFSTVTWSLFTFAFQYYVNQFSNYSRFYGALGAVVALMLWLLLTSEILLIGVEWNAVLLEINQVEEPFNRPLKYWNHFQKNKKSEKETDKNEQEGRNHPKH